MNRVLSVWVVVSSLVLGSAHVAIAAESSSSSSSEAAAIPTTTSGPICVSDQAKKTLDVCPEGPSIQSVPHGKAPAMSFHSKVEEVKKGDKKNEIGSADVQMLAGIRDQRQTALKQRVLALLVTEIQQLESLYRSTEARSKDRPQLLRRLAEDYVELENAAFREKTVAEEN